MIYDNVLEAMGHTPLIRLQRLVDPAMAQILVKYEGVNIGGSVKTRTAAMMIEEAERRGDIGPGSIIVEPTSGNQGIGLALVCAVKGYEARIIMPDSVSEERRLLVEHYGATAVIVHDEGDIGIPWRYVTVHAIFQDTRAVQMRGIWHRIADTEHLTQLRALVEDWNTTRIGPKAYLTVADGGVVRLHGEYTYPLEAGMTDRQLEDFVFGGCRLIVALMHEAEEQFPDELRGSLEP